MLLDTIFVLVTYLLTQIDRHTEDHTTPVTMQMILSRLEGRRGETESCRHTVNDVGEIECFLLLIEYAEVECCAIAYLIIAVKLGPANTTTSIQHTTINLSITQNTAV